MTYQATTDATRTPYSPILSDLYTRKMETEAHLQAQAHQQAGEEAPHEVLDRLAAQDRSQPLRGDPATYHMAA